MTFADYLRSKSGHIVNVSIEGMSEWVEEHDGRMMLTGRLIAYDDYVTLTSANGTTTAVPIRFIMSVDWSMEEQIEVEHITPDDFR